MVGPPLSALDADLGFQMSNVAPSMKPKDAQRAARQHAASQEARGLLGGALRSCWHFCMPPLS